MKKMLFLLITLMFLGFSPYANKQQPQMQESIKRGKLVYEDFCVTCHLPNGEGIKGVFPPLANSDYLIKNREGSIRAIKYGQSGEIIVNGVIYNNTMAPMGLTDDEIADVMNYINNTWGNSSKKMVTKEEVSAVKQ